MRRREQKRRRVAKLVLKKHSALIQMSNVVTGVQRKAWNFMLHKARQALRTAPERKIFEAGIGEIHQWTGAGATHRVHLKNMLRELKRIEVEFNILRKDGEHWGCFSLLSSVEILPDGTVRYEFPERIRLALLRPTMYAPIDLAILRGLRSKYAIALYEVAKDYIGVSVPEMTVEELRDLFGVGRKQYKRDRDLKRRVLDPAVREINEATDIEISYTIFKNRKTHRWERIRFSVRPKGEGIAPEDIAYAYDRALKHGCMPPPGRFTRPQILWFFLSADEPDYIAGLIRAALERGIENPVGFVRSKLQSPPDQRFEALLYHEQLRPEWEEAIYSTFAVRVRVPARWREMIGLGVITPEMATSMIEKLIEAGQAREVVAGGEHVYLEFLPEMHAGRVQATEYVHRLILPGIGELASLE